LTGDYVSEFFDMEAAATTSVSAAQSVATRSSNRKSAVTEIFDNK
jgi:hypothetical protein